MPTFLERLVATRHGGTVLFYLLFMAISLVVPFEQEDEAFHDTAVAYYQTAAARYEADTYRDLTSEELERYKNGPPE